MAIPREFEALFEHPNPGLHFPPHGGAHTPERTVPVIHAANPPASAKSLAWLKKELGACTAAQAQLLEFYTRWDGANLVCMRDDETEEYNPHFFIPSVEEMKALTAQFEPAGDSAWMVEDLAEMYVPGSFIVIAATPSEGTHLTLFSRGHFEGLDLAGRVFYLAMDPVLNATEPVAESFFSLLTQLAADPAAFLNRLGTTFCLTVGEDTWGDVPDSYLPDCGITPQ